MITIKSKSYNNEDAGFVAIVINRGLCGCCEKYSACYGPLEIDCSSCQHKIACADLQSAYHYMLAKSLRMYAEDYESKVDPLESELPDS